jgi:hypothetical protein
MRRFTLTLIALLLSGASQVRATTYDYLGQPFTNFQGLCDASTCTSLTGTVTFNFDTSNFTGKLSLAAVDSASLTEGFSSPPFTPLPGPFMPVFPSSTIWFNPPQNTYGFVSEITVANFTLVNGAITSWLFGGSTGQVGCGGGPGCAVGSSDAVTTPTFDGSDIFTYAILSDSSASNNGGGVWTESPAVPAVPESSTWAMLLIGFAGIGFLSYRRSLSALHLYG